MRAVLRHSLEPHGGSGRLTVHLSTRPRSGKDVADKYRAQALDALAGKAAPGTATAGGKCSPSLARILSLGSSQAYSGELTHAGSLSG